MEKLQQEAVAFRRECDSIMLSTISPDGIPDASYAPCFLDGEGRCHVLVSQLARHTGNLVSQPLASLMWIEDKNSSRNPFARRRLVLQCRAIIIERDSKEHEEAVTKKIYRININDLDEDGKVSKELIIQCPGVSGTTVTKDCDIDVTVREMPRIFPQKALFTLRVRFMLNCG